MSNEPEAQNAKPRSHAKGRGGSGAHVDNIEVQGGPVNNDLWEAKTLLSFERAISPERLAPYRGAANGDLLGAVKLYNWNTAVSATFYGPLQTLEVALRNAMHRELEIKYGPGWFNEAAPGLDNGARNKIAEVRRKLAREGYLVDPPHVVASLSLGFWVSLLGPGGVVSALGVGQGARKADYERTLWRSALYKAFPHAKLSRRAAHAPVEDIRKLRNRIAHHEPVFARDLSRDHETLLKVASWIDPVVYAWIVMESRAAEVISLRPMLP